MGNLHLVTGFAGQPHVSAADHGSFIEALIRGGDFVMTSGHRFDATIVSNNQIRISDGELMIQGRHVKLNPGSYVDLSIENGTQGYQRNDLIVARYTRNGTNGIEECNLVVLKGSNVSVRPADPTYTVTPDINALTGSLQHDFPLYRVPLSGLTVGKLVPLFTPQMSIFDNMLPKSGAVMEGNLNMNGYGVAGLRDPSASSDAVTLGYANNKFAPNGYGLGAASHPFTWSEVEKLQTTGWYSSVVNGEIAYGVHAYSVWVRVEGYDSQNTHLTIYNSANNSVFHRDRRQGVWGAYRIENPPLLEGGEYLTTERYQGADVWKKVDSNGNILWRKDGDTKWHLLAASTGMGESEYFTADTIDNVLTNGWYRTTDLTINGTKYNYVYMRVDAYNTTACTQTLYILSENGLMLRRCRYASTWGEWEWDNPPMIVNVEYRTTERWGGKPVYRLRHQVNLGKVGTPGLVENYGITFNSQPTTGGGTNSKIDKIIRCDAWNTDGDRLPYLSQAGGVTAIVESSGNGINLRTDGKMTWYPSVDWVFDLAYTKEV